MGFWRNPELVRHLRSELRPIRALTAGLLVIVICILVGLSCWGAVQDNPTPRQFARTFYIALMIIQGIVLCLWCLATCGQAIAREREMKTYDFLKTTRLSSGELLLGKLLGAPIVGYFAFACSLPVSLLAGLFAGFSVGVLLATYLLIITFGLFCALAGLWLSMLLEKSSPVAVLGLLLLGPLWGIGFAFSESPCPGCAAISVPVGITSLYHQETWSVRTTFLGMQAPLVLLNLVFYVSLGAWLVLMLQRNLKKDLEQIRLLSRWQAVGFAAYLNALFYAFLDPRRVGTKPQLDTISPAGVSNLAVALNPAFLLLVGLATLAPRERLKIWWRRRSAGEATYLSGDGLPWPWMALAAAAAYALLAAEAVVLAGAIPLREWRLGTAAVQLLLFLVFTVRDVLFLQWCSLTHMKRPVLKGFLYLCLYYIAVTIVAIVAALVSSSLGELLLSLWTPYLAFAHEGGLKTSPGALIGLALQVGIILFLLHAISRRLQRPAAALAA